MKEKTKTPKFKVQMLPANGKSIDEIKQEYGLDGETTVIDGSGMDVEQIKAMMAQMGVNPKGLDKAMAGGGKKKPGIFQKLQNKLME